ncbi:MAG: PaaI family thioesterase [Spirochaetota bacterium]
MKILEGNENILQELSKASAAIANPRGTAVEVPPKCAYELQAEFLEYQFKKSLKLKFPVPEKYANPAGVLQGGFLTAMFDNSFGPLSYLVAKKPTTSLDIITHYVRPIKVNHPLFITVQVVSRSKATMYMTGDAFDEKDRLLGSASTNMMIFT